MASSEGLRIEEKYGKRKVPWHTIFQNSTHLSPQVPDVSPDASNIYTLSLTFKKVCWSLWDCNVPKTRSFFTVPAFSKYKVLPLSRTNLVWCIYMSVKNWRVDWNVSKIDFTSVLYIGSKL
jgi:hypothetical protein